MCYTTTTKPNAIETVLAFYFLYIGRTFVDPIFRIGEGEREGDMESEAMPVHPSSVFGR